MTKLSATVFVDLVAEYSTTFAGSRVATYPVTENFSTRFVRCRSDVTTSTE